MKLDAEITAIAKYWMEKANDALASAFSIEWMGKHVDDINC